MKAAGASRRGGSITAVLAVAPALLLAACDQPASQAKSAPVPTVEVSEAVSRTVPVYREFVGNTEAVKSVEVRANVEGYLVERRFTEGAAVKKGDVLFVIDRRPFEAALSKSKAELQQSEASLKFARQQVARYRPLAQKSDVSRQRLEELESEAAAAEAAVKADEAAVKSAQLDLDYATIAAPIDGQVGETLVNVGNLISAADTELTELVQLDPIYAYINPSEAQFREIEAYRARGPQRYRMLLSDGTVYPHDGKLDFVANEVDARTGTLRVRIVFPNPDRSERPGQFVRVRVTLGEKTNAILVPAPAVGEGQVGHYVYLVGRNDVVEQRRITLGPAVDDHYVVEKGLSSGDRVVVQGLQKVRGGQKVKIETAARPATAPAAKKAAEPASK